MWFVLLFVFGGCWFGPPAPLPDPPSAVLFCPSPPSFSLSLSLCVCVSCSFVSVLFGCCSIVTGARWSWWDCKICNAAFCSTSFFLNIECLTHTLCCSCPCFSKCVVLTTPSWNHTPQTSSLTFSVSYSTPRAILVQGIFSQDLRFVVGQVFSFFCCLMPRGWSKTPVTDGWVQIIRDPHPKSETWPKAGQQKVPPKRKQWTVGARQCLSAAQHQSTQWDRERNVPGEDAHSGISLGFGGHMRAR